jgi:hypothetical protein
MRGTDPGEAGRKQAQNDLHDYCKRKSVCHKKDAPAYGSSVRGAVVVRAAYIDFVS